jgi:hypothetical protein
MNQAVQYNERAKCELQQESAFGHGGLYMEMTPPTKVDLHERAS